MFGYQRPIATKYNCKRSLTSTVLLAPGIPTGSAEMKNTKILSTLRSSAMLFLLVIMLDTTRMAVMAQEACSPCANSLAPDFSTPICRDTAETIVSGLAAGSRECGSAQLTMFQLFCCPSPPSGFCEICPGGDFDNNIIVPGNLFGYENDLTCEELEQDDYAYDLDMFTPDNPFGTCPGTYMQSSAAWCGCSTSNVECTLCADGSKPQFPDRVENFFSFGWDCTTIEYITTFANVTSCGRFLENALPFDAPSYCGCPDKQAPNICGLCPPEHQVLDPDLIVPLLSTPFGLPHPTCGQIDDSMRHVPTGESCSELHELLHIDDGVAEYCCGLEPLVGCELCPGGTFDASIEIPGILFGLEDGEGITCGDFGSFELSSERDPFFENPDPNSCSSSLLEKSSAWCGCDNRPKACTLCPNGAGPPDKSRVEKLLFGVDCETFDWMASFLSSEECPNLVENLGFDVVSYCKCPGSTPAGKCDVCPDGMSFRNPQSFLPDGSGITCGELEDSMSSISDESSCEGARAALHTIDNVVRLCCEKKGGASVSSPGDTPGASPSGNGPSNSDLATTSSGSNLLAGFFSMALVSLTVSGIQGWLLC